MIYFNWMQQLWQDDCGGIVTSEYLLLGTVLTVGTVSGMTAMRDATVEELKETGNSMRSVREHYTPKFTNPQTANNTSSRTNPYLQGHYGCENGVCP